MPKWIRDYLVLPLVVGLVLALVTFALPRLTTDEFQLSYEIDTPTPVLDDPAVRQVSIEVNGMPVSELYAFRVRLWNSGDKPISDLPVRLIIEPEESDFSILNVAHQTTPPYEFGRIEELNATPVERRYRYELLNPGDEDIVTVLADGAATLSLYTKAKGLEVIKRELPQRNDGLQGWTVFLAGILGALASLLALALRAVQSMFHVRSQEWVRSKVSGESGTQG